MADGVSGASLQPLARLIPGIHTRSSPPFSLPRPPPPRPPPPQLADDSDTHTKFVYNQNAQNDMIYVALVGAGRG